VAIFPRSIRSWVPMWRGCPRFPHYAVLAVSVFDSWSSHDNPTKIFIPMGKPNVIAYSNHSALLTSSSSLTCSSDVLPLSQVNHLTATTCAPFAFTWRIFTTVPGSSLSGRDCTMSPTRKMGFPHASLFLIVASTSACNSWCSSSRSKRGRQTPSRRAV